MVLKTILTLVILLGIAPLSPARDNQLADEWTTMIRDAAADAKVHLRSSRVASFQGVHTMIPEPSFGRGSDKMDAALALFWACSSQFSDRIVGEGKEGRSSLAQRGDQNESGGLSFGGHYIQRFSAKNGDQVQLIYLAPKELGGSASITIVFVEASALIGASGA